MAATRSQPPEALGPGVDTPSGEVIYGVPGTRVHIEPRVTAEERDRIRAQAERNARCPRCMSLPDDVVASIAAALRTAAREGRRR